MSRKIRGDVSSSLQLLLFPTRTIISGGFAHRLNNFLTHPVSNAFLVWWAMGQHKMRCSCRNEAVYDLARRRWILSVDDELYGARKRCGITFNS